MVSEFCRWPASHSPLLIMKQPVLLLNLLPTPPQLGLTERSSRDAAAPRQLGPFILRG
jgi:hypothetical protein